MDYKEKALELIEQFKPLVYCYVGSGFMTGTEDEDVILMNAKKCAMIVVDENIDTCNEMITLLHSNGQPESSVWYQKNYDWVQIKNELFKL
jgi:hypothetical protein